MLGTNYPATWPHTHEEQRIELEILKKSILNMT
jgi:hypothetical protein